MSDIEIRGGAGEFEAALIAVVVDQVRRDEAEASRRIAGDPSDGRSAWVRALPQLRPGETSEEVWPA